MKTWETEVPALATLGQLPWQGHRVNCTTPKGPTYANDSVTGAPWSCAVPQPWRINAITSLSPYFSICNIQPNHICFVGSIRRLMRPCV